MSTQTPPPAQPPRVLTESQMRAAQLLILPNQLASLTPQEAMVVIDFMRPKRIAAGTTFITEGEKAHTDFLILVIEGDVTVETQSPGQKTGTVINTLGPGSILGDISFMDGQPRTSTCIAATDMAVGVLTRTRLRELFAQEPTVALKFMVMLQMRASVRARNLVRKLTTFMQMNDVLREQLDAVMNSRLPPNPAQSGQASAAARGPQNPAHIPTLTQAQATRQR